MIVYGIKNCDTVQKALTWLKENHFEYEFHDFKKKGVAVGKLEEWAEKVGWENLLNKRGITWKKLDPAIQQAITSPEAAYNLLQEKTSIIKRPVIETKGVLLFGFDENAYQSQLVTKK